MNKLKLLFFTIGVFLVLGFQSFISFNFFNDFKEDQLRYPRVRTAYSEKESIIKEMLDAREISKPFSIYIRSFKYENSLEVWAKSNDRNQYVLLKEYGFCQNSSPKNTLLRREVEVEFSANLVTGTLGPKRRQGDGQIPEGVYHIDRFNPASNFYLSLGVNYPNQADRILGHSENLGGDIFIHGDCVTVGCVPITDEKIKELYILAVEAKDSGQEKIPVHMFPAKLSEHMYSNLSAAFAGDEEFLSLWKQLAEVYQYFEEHQNIPDVSIDSEGRYIIRD